MSTRKKTGCIGCGGPCTTPCTDNFGGKYLGCDRGCRLLTADELLAKADGGHPNDVAFIRSKLAREIGSAWAKALEHLCHRAIAAGVAISECLIVQKFRDEKGDATFSASIVESWVVRESEPNHDAPRYPMARRTLLEDRWVVEIIEAPPVGKRHP